MGTPHAQFEDDLSIRAACVPAGQLLWHAFPDDAGRRLPGRIRPLLPRSHGHENHVCQSRQDRQALRLQWQLHRRPVDRSIVFGIRVPRSPRSLPAGQNRGCGEKGKPLGKPGATGNSSGIHVHLQTNNPKTSGFDRPAINNGNTYDPVSILRQQKVNIQRPPQTHEPRPGGGTRYRAGRMHQCGNRRRTYQFPAHDGYADTNCQ